MPNISYTEPYNLTQLTSISSFGDLAHWANTVSNDLFWGALVIIIVLILIVRHLKDKNTLDSVMTSCLIGFVISLFLRFAGLVSTYLVIGLAVITAIILGWAAYTSK